MSDNKDLSTINRKTLPPTIAYKWPIKRLLNRLHHEARNPVVWVSASAGSGKTVLAVSYLEQYNMPHAWYQLDWYDGIPETFFRYLYLALQPHLDDPDWQPSYYKPSLHSDLNRFADTYFSQLMGRLSEDVALVFDNFQEVSTEQGFPELFIRLINAIPSDMRIIVLSRNAITAEYNPLIVDRLLGFIGTEDMKLSVKEARQLISHVYPEQSVSDTLLSNMLTTSNGWVTALVLQMEALRMNISSGSLVEQPQSRIFDYFTNEIFYRTSQSRRDFLLYSSFFPRFNLTQLEKFYSFTDHVTILRDLVSKNQFIYCQHEEHVESYHYHPLFREFLIHRAREHFSREEYHELITRAANIIVVSTSDIELAMPMFIDAAAWDRVTELLNQHAQMFIALGRHKTVSSWLSRIPGEITTSVPWLQFWAGNTQFIESPQLGYQSICRAFDLFSEQHDLTGQLISWTSAVTSVFILWDDFTLIDRWLEWLDNYLDSGGDIPENIIGARLATAALTAHTMRRPIHHHAIHMARETIRLAEQFGSRDDKLLAYSQASVFHSFFGSRSDGYLILERGNQLYRHNHGDIIVNLTWTWMCSAPYWINGQPEHAQNLLKDGIELATNSDIHVCDTMFSSFGAYQAFNLNDLPAALELIQRTLSHTSVEQGHILGHCHYLMTWYFLRTKNPSDALSHIIESTLRVERSGSVWTQSVAYLLHVRTLAMLGRFDDATTLLDKAKLQIATSVNCSFFNIHCLLEEAWLHYRAGNTESALELSENFFEQIVENGYRSLFGWDPELISELAALLFRHTINNNSIATLIRQRNIPPPPGFPASLWPWRIHITTFPDFTLMVDGTPLTYRGKGKNKPLALLKTLIALGGKNVPEQAICASLWPDAEGDVAHINFTSTLYRLRKILPRNDILILKEHRLSLDTEIAFVDLREFNKIASRLSSRLTILPAPDADEIMQWMDSMLVLYRGPFLANDQEAHYICVRDAISDKWLSLLHQTANFLMQQKRWSSAIRVYEKALEIDSADETIYRGLLEVCLHTGKITEAEALYQRCVRELEKQFGRKPEGRTTLLYQSLR